MVVNDGERATPTRATLDALAAIAPAAPSIRLLVATGTHRPSAEERARFVAALTDGLALRVAELRFHDAGAGDLVPIGGAPFHRWLAAEATPLAIGSVEPHYFAGLAGAHKTLTVGLLGRAAIEANHRGALTPGSAPFVLRGNPVHEGIVELLRGLATAGHRPLAINHLAVAGRSIAVAVGEPLATLETLAPGCRRIFGREIPHPVDLLHLRVPLPLGRSLYQADKALKNNHHAVRDRGGILLEAPCPDGVGPQAFLDLLAEAPDYATVLEVIARRGYRLGDHKAAKLRRLTDPRCRGVRVALVAPGVPTAAAQVAGLTPFSSIDEAKAWLRATTTPADEELEIDDAAMVVVSPGLGS